MCSLTHSESGQKLAEPLLHSGTPVLKLTQVARTLQPTQEASFLDCHGDRSVGRGMESKSDCEEGILICVASLARAVL
ncbi:hypothetical protein INR49_025867 [Caranx melampygus]|nr:hypothetical protein INR49_025867 [Caranx melampygus]